LAASAGRSRRRESSARPAGRHEDAT
jgi:hypothetical protein